MLVRMLERQGHVCDEASNGQEALELIMKQGNKYDCILMDYEMPNINGPSGTSRLRAMGVTTLIVGITCNVLPDDLLFYKKMGADYILEKPIDLREIEKIWAKHGLAWRKVCELWCFHG